MNYLVKEKLGSTGYFVKRNTDKNGLPRQKADLKKLKNLCLSVFSKSESAISVS